MRILLINDYASESYGSERQISGLSYELRKRGHDARVFASKVSAVSGREVFADYQCIGAKKHFRTILQTANPFAFFKLRKVIKEFNPEVVHIRIFLTQMSPLILPLLKPIPCLYQAVIFRSICPMGTKMNPDGSICYDSPGVICYHKGCVPLRSLFFQLLELKLFKMWSKYIDMIFTISNSMKLHLMAQGLKTDMVIWNPVQKRSCHAQLSEPPMVAFAGRIVKEKGVNILVKAFAEVLKDIPTAKMIISGTGPEHNYIQKLIINLSLESRVNLTGHLIRNDLEQEFDKAWVQVVPSIWDEPFGNVAAEAMMRGTAVIASNVGGLAEIIQDKHTGFLVPPGDAHALAFAMKRILKDQSLAEQMGLAGREFALKYFDQEIYINKIIQLYNSLISRNR